MEVRRAIRRAVFDRRISAKAQQVAFRKVDAFVERCTVIAMTPAVLQRASEPFPVEPVRSPDAIHLATLAISGAGITVLSNDERGKP